MSFRYLLRLSDGTDVGDAEYAVRLEPGDEFRASGNRRMRVLAVVPLEKVGEFVDDAVYGVLQVEQLA